MKQTENLFATSARCIGMEVFYDMNVYDLGVHGTLSIQPKWSKRPSEPGNVYLVIDEGDVDVVPDLLRDAWDGMVSGNPGYYVPRWVNEHYRKYQEASNKKA